MRAVAEPFIVASIEPVDDKELRVRGPLLSVNTAASSYLVDVRPFNLRDARLGQLTIHTTPSTHFEVDGNTFTGAAGLEALSQLAIGSATATFGTLDLGSRSSPRNACTRAAACRDHSSMFCPEMSQRATATL